MTRFQILSSWVEHSIEEAHNASEAVKKGYLKNPDGGITAMVAVPLRSWKPQAIRTETVTKIVLGEEKQDA